MTLPEDFINATKAAMDEELWLKLAGGLAATAPVSIRINPYKCNAGSTDIAGCSGKVPWCKDGYYLATRPNFTFDPMLHAGMYYVQEASSMFLDLVLRQHAGTEPVTMLDMCAAPGGKSTVARAALPEGSLLVCNEPMRTRAQILAENIRKFGHEDVIVTNNYPKDIKRSGLKFDIILTDVPCSGEGMFRKDATAISEWSLQNVEKCRRLQREIVDDAWECLKPGGLLIYSTCTFNTKEDEENVAYICDELGASPVDVDIDDRWGITGSILPGMGKPVFRFLPGLTMGEGLFMTVMRKGGDGPTGKRETKDRKREKNKAQGRKDSATAVTAKWIESPTRFDTVTSGNTIAAIPHEWRSVYDMASKSLKVLSAGVTLGEIKGKDIIPSQALALSRVRARGAFASVDLDYTQAISYLRKEAVALPPETPRGYILVTYRGVPLGFEKNIGNRANNLYPAEWKIKSTHTPDGDNVIIKR